MSIQDLSVPEIAGQVGHFSFRRSVMTDRYDYAILESHRIVPETCFSQAVKSYFIFKENLNKKYPVVTKISFIKFWGGWTRTPI